MITAIGMYHRAREQAFDYRTKALWAAQHGYGQLAIHLTSLAQAHDRIAEDWQDRIPDWQRDAWREEEQKT